jgi:hypothetical protein
MAESSRTVKIFLNNGEARSYENARVDIDTEGWIAVSSPGIPALPVMRLLSTGYIFYFRKRNSMFIKRLGRFPRLWQLGNHVIH